MIKNRVKLFMWLFLLSSGNAIAQNILVIYDSKSGHTRQMAVAVANGAKQIAGIEVKLLSVKKVTFADVKKAQAVIMGSPVYNANITPELQAFINTWPHDSMRNKLGAAFVSAGGISAGQESTLLNIVRTMLIFRMIVVGGETWEAPFGAAAIVNEQPFHGKQIAPQFLARATELGKRVAATLKNFKS